MKIVLFSFLIVTLSWSSDAFVKSVKEKIGESPWHVGVYEDRLYRCGGTILTKKIVISAAKCFADTEGNFKKDQTFRIAAGKILRELRDAEDTAQKRDVSKVISHENFKGVENLYENDIALLILDTKLEFNENVKPVSLDFSIFDDGKMSKDALGKVVGWGVVSGLFDPASATLTGLKLPIIGRASCEEKLESRTKVLLVQDKICAGYLNAKTGCITESGSGLVFPYEKDGQTKYYLRGIIKSDPFYMRKTDCKSSGIYLFTDVLSHHAFIEENMNLHT